MSTKTISPDDPRLTAYALGEMSDGERAAFERELAHDPAAQQAIADIRGLGGQLEAALATEPVPATNATPDRPMAEAAIVAGPDPRKLDGGLVVRRFRSTQWFYLASGLAAAGLVAVIAVKGPDTRPAPKVERVMETPRSVAPLAAKAVPSAPAASTPVPAPAARLANGRAASATTMDTAPLGAPDRPKRVAHVDAQAAPALPNFAEGSTPAPLTNLLGEGAGLVAQSKALADTRRSAADASAPMMFAAPSAEVQAEVARRRVAKVQRESAVRATEARAAIHDLHRGVAAGVVGGAPGAKRWAGTGGPAIDPADSLVAANEQPAMLSPLNVERPMRRGYEGTATLAGTRAASTRTFNTESYAYRPESDFVSVAAEPLSTFSADVDTASYANVRRFVARGELPPPDAVRIEELLNAFTYDYVRPTGSAGATKAADAPFAADLEVASAPWVPAHRLVRIGIRGRDVPIAARGAANLVFLLDVSGSMADENKLPLVKRAMTLLLTRLRPDDRVAIVTYAGTSGLALPSTPLSHRSEIAQAIEGLSAGGSTNGALGIQLAYDVAKANFVTGGVNRVILCTDGDFNVGTTSEGSLVRLIKEKAGTGVFLSVFGFGMGNLKDSMLQQIADAGNGNYGYIDTLAEAERRLVGQVNGTLVTIAKDVKLQVEFNPARVSRYRLIGYEKRRLAATDFKNDAVDAGEIGAGHTVTALYEIEPATAESAIATREDESRPQRYVDSAPAPAGRGAGAAADELLVLRIRYKEPDGVGSRKLEFPLKDAGAAFDQAGGDFKFAAAVAAFGMLLRDSAFAGDATLDRVAAWAQAGTAADPDGSRTEFVQLVRQVDALRGQRPGPR
jgi:Ca-activated chloride channel family protein